MVRSFLTVLAVAMPAFAQKPDLKAGFPPLPEKLAAKPDADPILKLRIELHNTLLDALAEANRRISGGVSKESEIMQTRDDLVRQLLDVTMEIETDPQRKVEAIKRMVELAVYVEAIMEGRRNLDLTRVLPNVKAQRLELEIRLAEFEKSLKK